MIIDNQAVGGQAQQGVSGSWAVAQAGVPVIGATPGYVQRFALWQFYSQNNISGAGTLASVQAGYDNYVEQFIDLCHNNNVIPIIMTHIPSGHFGPNPGVDDLRKSLNDQVRGLAAADVLIYDPDPWVTDGGSPAQLQGVYSQPDGTHLTAAGNQIMGTVFDALMRNYYLTH